VTNGDNLGIDDTTVKKKVEKNQYRPDILSRKEPPPPEKTGWLALTVK
jgi:hypothetical protein